MALHSSLCKTGIIQWHLGALHCRSPLEKAIKSVNLKHGPVFHPGAVSSPCIPSWIYSTALFVLPSVWVFFPSSWYFSLPEHCNDIQRGRIPTGKTKFPYLHYPLCLTLPVLNLIFASGQQRLCDESCFSTCPS